MGPINHPLTVICDYFEVFIMDLKLEKEIELHYRHFHLPYQQQYDIPSDNVEIV
jgi:hypothetical protein